MRRILLRFTDFKDNSPERLEQQPIFLPDGSTRPLGFFCDVDGDPTPVLRDGELALAEWHTPEDVPADYSRISLTGEMIDRFREGRIPK